MVDIKFKYKVALSCIVIMMVFVTLSGFSYAYFVASVEGTGNPLIVTTEGVDLTLTEGSDDIALVAAKPIPDGDGIKGTPHTFTLTNNNSYAVKAYIYLSVSSDSGLDAQYIKYAYVNNGGSFNESDAKKLSDIKEPNTPINDKYKNSYLLDTVDLTATGTDGATKNGFKILLWIDNELNEVVTCNDEGLCSPSEPTTMGKTFNARITIKTEPNREANNQSSTVSDQGVANGPQIFDSPSEIQGAGSEVITPEVTEPEVVNPAESETPENDVPVVVEPGTEDVPQNGEGMEVPSIG